MPQGTILVPITQMEFEDPLPIDLDSDSTRIIGPEDCPKEINDLRLGSNFEVKDFQQLTTILEIKKAESFFTASVSYNAKADVTDRFREVYDQIQIVFKLFKDDSLAFAPLFLYEIGNGWNLIPINYYNYWRRPETIPTYKLLSSDLERFKRYWQKFKDIPRSQFAVLRFHLADFRPLSHDRFVDYMLALECLFVPYYSKKKMKEVEKAARFILGHGMTDDQPGLFLEQLKNYYDIRSRIVHGGKVLLKGNNSVKSWEQFNAPLRLYLRNAIKYFHLNECLAEGKQEERKKHIEECSVKKRRFYSVNHPDGDDFLDVLPDEMIRFDVESFIR